MGINPICVVPSRGLDAGCLSAVESSLFTSRNVHLLNKVQCTSLRIELWQSAPWSTITERYETVYRPLGEGSTSS